MIPRGLHLPVALAAVLLLDGPTPAQARFTPCRDIAGAQCERVQVPLDHSGRASGRLGLHVVRMQARRPTRRALVYLSGGPGGAAVPEFAYALGDRPIRRLRARYHLATFDQRGTGRSGLLRCPGLERDARLRSIAAAGRCAQRLGAGRAFYTTQATVEDLEAVRRSLGVRRLLLYGVSYGTKVALAYARAYPQRVERLLLDSVVDPHDDDVFGLEPYRNLEPSLRGLCPRRCRGVSADPVGDLGRLTAGLAERPVRGVSALMVSDLLFDADYAPELRAGVPASVQSLLRHDNPAPLRRAVRASRSLAAPGPPRDFSAARYATVCEEAELPWPRGTPFDERLGVARQRAAALGPGALAPFGFEVVRADEIDLCLRWPEAPAAPSLADGPYPDVPALVLQGLEDLRTPATASLRVARALPRAQRVVVPGVGHAVLGSDPTGCAQRRLRRWLAGGRVAARCPRVATGVPAAPVLPRRLDQLGGGGRIARTVAAIGLTVADLDFLLSPAFTYYPTNRGLVGGRISFASRSLRLRRFSAMRGLWLDGRVRPNGVIEARVGGRQAARGRVTVSPGGRVRGRLGGRRVSARPGAAARMRAATASSRPRSPASSDGVAPLPVP